MFLFDIILVDYKERSMSKRKNWWQKFIDKLALANQKEYGNDVPDCCGDGKIKKQEINL